MFFLESIKQTPNIVSTHHRCFDSQGTTILKGKIITLIHAFCLFSRMTVTVMSIHFQRNTLVISNTTLLFSSVQKGSCDIRNNLPQSIRDTTSLCLFMKQLKTFTVYIELVICSFQTFHYVFLL